MTPDEIRTVIRATLRSRYPHLETFPLEGTEPLDNSGINSLGLLQTIVALEEQFSVSVDDDYLVPERLRTLDDLVLIFHALVPAAP